MYALIPHTGCILFIVFTVLGVTAATAVFRQFLMNPYAFYILIGLSFVLATVSAIIYLRRNVGLNVDGMKRKWKYLSILYGTTLIVNVLFFTVIFPAATNAITVQGPDTGQVVEPLSVSLQVTIPCSGHALLISSEIQKVNGVLGVKYRQPNFFDVSYDGSKTNEGAILKIDVFKTYPARVTASNFGV